MADSSSVDATLVRRTAAVLALEPGRTICIDDASLRGVITRIPPCQSGVGRAAHGCISASTAWSAHIVLALEPAGTVRGRDAPSGLIGARVWRGRAGIAWATATTAAAATRRVPNVLRFSRRHARVAKALGGRIAAVAAARRGGVGGGSDGRFAP